MYYSGFVDLRLAWIELPDSLRWFDVPKGSIVVDRVVIRNLNSQTARGKLDRIVRAGKKLGIGVIGEALRS